MKFESKLLTKRCKRCGYVWEARIKNPKKCPKCQSWNWDKKKGKK